jgi:two-component system, response regulator
MDTLVAEHPEISAVVEVLLVEDSWSDAEVIVRELRRHDLAHAIHVARDSVQAIDFLFCRGSFAVRSFLAPPRLVLLGIGFGKVSGLDVLAAIKSDARTKAIPVVLLTTSEAADVAEGYRLGANAIVQRPADFRDFCHVLEQLGKFWLRINQVPPAEFALGIDERALATVRPNASTSGSLAPTRIAWESSR